MIEVITCIEGGVADELKNAPVDRVGPRAGDHVGITCRPVTDLGRQHARTRLHFFEGVHIEIGKRGAAHLRIGGVGAIDRKNCGCAALPIDGKLLRKVCGTVRIRHGARR